MSSRLQKRQIEEYKIPVYSSVKYVDQEIFASGMRIYIQNDLLKLYSNAQIIKLFFYIQ